jgi:uncharacterized protein (DUF305 family)
MLVPFGEKMTLFSRTFIRKRAISIATTVSVAAISVVMADGPSSADRARETMPIRYERMPIQYIADRTDNSDEASFLSENESAMSKMMTDMMVKPTGNVDRDFVSMMVPHHRAAIDMAQTELKYGHNELLRRLARKIAADQQQEIRVMRLAVDDERPLPEGSPAQPTRDSKSPAMSHATMGAAGDAKQHN